MDDIFCLLVTGGPIHEHVLCELFHVAREMLREEGKRRSLGYSGLEGEIQTEFRHTCIGGVSGVVFTADVEYSNKKLKVKYVVRASNLEMDDRRICHSWDRSPNPGMSMN